ncbi:hypothetical protein E2C01_095610 [Portunus trituberculatus]|uniref:Uncharacterized protein n=1 Tax=Portunus trituberculatus TaxID=210409 RepID=A0A5B7K672_PORTR|nr:hypothetical protein [Portunus trituberculatus]
MDGGPLFALQPAYKHITPSASRVLDALLRGAAVMRRCAVGDSRLARGMGGSGIYAGFQFPLFEYFQG